MPRIYDRPGNEPLDPDQLGQSEKSANSWSPSSNSSSTAQGKTSYGSEQAAVDGAGDATSSTSPGKTNYDPTAPKSGSYYSPTSSATGLGKGKIGGFFNSPKKWALASVAALVAAIVAAVVIFFTLLPLKIVHMMANIQAHFFATTQNATEKATNRLLQSYLRDVVFPELKSCTSTLSPNCKVVAGQGGGPIRQLYRAWAAGRLERNLALNYGIEFRFDGATNQYFIRSPSLPRDVNITDFADRTVNDIFDAKDWDQIGSTREFRRQLNQRTKVATADLTRWEKVLVHYKVRRLAKLETGLPSCVIACTSGVKGYLDDFRDWKADLRKKTARIVLTSRVLGPRDAMEKLAIQCLFDKSCTRLIPGEQPDLDGDGKCVSKCTGGGKSELELKNKIYAEVLSAPGFGHLDDAGKVEAFNKYYDGYHDSKSPYVRRYANLSGLIFEKLGGVGKKKTGEEVGEQLAKKGINALPVIGTIVFVGAEAASWIDTYKFIAENSAKVGYVMKATAAAQVFKTYATYADEIKEGKVDAEMVGAFTEALNSNPDADMGGTASAENAPAYPHIIGKESIGTASISLNNVLGGKAQAVPAEHVYRCDYGLGHLSACMEERFDAKSRAQENWDQQCKSSEGIPGCQTLAAIGHGFNEITNHLGSFLGFVLCKIPTPACLIAQGLLELVEKLLGVVGKFTQLDEAVAHIFTDHFMPRFSFSPNGSGARIAQNIFAGASYIGNEAAHSIIGGVKLTGQQVADIVAEQEESRLAEYKSQPFLARVFDKESPYSPVSKLAMAMPSSPGESVRGFMASLASNPIGKILSSFSSIFNMGLSPAYAVSNPTLAKGAPACNELKDPQYEFDFLDDSGWLSGHGNGLGAKYWQPRPPHKYEDFVPRGVEVTATYPDGTFAALNPDKSGYDGNKHAPNYCDPGGGNPWGISEYGYPQDHPIFKVKDPVAYYDQNCKTSAKTMLYNLKGASESEANKVTGQAENWYDPGDPDLGANPCLLWRTAATSACATQDENCLSPEELAEDGGGSVTPPPPPSTGLQSPPNLGPRSPDGYYRMPSSSLFVWNGGTPPDSRCGSKELIDVIYTVIARWNAMHPDHKILLGDLNASGHLSHRNGVDVDIYSVDGFVANVNGNRDASIALGNLFVDAGIVKEIYYNDTEVQQAVNTYAVSRGESSNFMYYQAGHEDHFHVRLDDGYRLPDRTACPPGI